MYRKRKKPNFVLLGILTFLLFFIVVSLNMYPKLKETNVTGFLKDIEVKIVSVVTKPVLYLKNQIKNSKDVKQLEKEYETLKKEKEEIDQKNAQIASLQKEVETMKKQLGLDTILGEKWKIHATVINRTTDEWNQKLTIDKGKKDGIIDGMAVIDHNGLIGITMQTSNHASSVELLTSENFTKISVRIKVGEQYIYGLLTGYRNGMFVIEGISENLSIPEGSVVTTTGMGKTFPAGLYIGKVKKVTTDNFDLAKIVEVTPATDFQDLSYVTVVKRDESYDS